MLVTVIVTILSLASLLDDTKIWLIRYVVISHKDAWASIVTVTVMCIFAKTACDSDSDYTFLGLLVTWHKILNSLYLLLFLTRKSVQVYSMLLTQAIIPTVTILAFFGFLGTKLVFFLFIVSCSWVFHLNNWPNVQFNTDLFSDMQKYLYISQMVLLKDN